MTLSANRWLMLDLMPGGKLLASGPLGGLDQADAECRATLDEQGRVLAGLVARPLACIDGRITRIWHDPSRVLLTPV